MLRDNLVFLFHVLDVPVGHVRFIIRPEGNGSPSIGTRQTPLIRRLTTIRHASVYQRHKVGQTLGHCVVLKENIWCRVNTLNKTIGLIRPGLIYER